MYRDPELENDSGTYQIEREEDEKESTPLVLVLSNHNDDEDDDDFDDYEEWHHSPDFDPAEQTNCIYAKWLWKKNLMLPFVIVVPYSLGTVGLLYERAFLEWLFQLLG